MTNSINNIIISVAICGIAGGRLVEEQVKILIGLNVDIVIAMDRGISKKVNENICEQFKGIRNVSYIWDEYGILKDKSSPIDEGMKSGSICWRTEFM